MPGLSLLSAAAQITLVAQSASPTSQPAVSAGFIHKTITIDGTTYAYVVYVPPTYDASQAWPVILFLHGSGQSGDDGFNQTDVGLPAMIRKAGLRPPAIIVMPQCRRDRSWTGDMARMALMCVDQASTEYSLDADRFYVTGLSLGGAGTWVIGAAMHERVAALVPVCGFGDVGAAPKLAPIPTWVFHGAADNRVPVGRSREMVEALRKAGGDPKYTEYAGVGHDCWDRAYREADLWKWLFAQKLSDRRKTGP